MTPMSRLGLAAGMLLLAGCMTTRPGPPYAVATRMDLAYGPRPAEHGDLYTPQGVAAAPVVILIHGGGWVNGKRGDDASLAQQFAARGIAAFNIDYRLATSADPESRWPAQIADAQLAVRWLRAHAAAYGIDPTRIGAAGDSAGAQMALLLGILQVNVPGDAAGLYSGQRPNVSAVADLFGPADIATLPPWVHGVYPALFGTAAPEPELVSAMSPLAQIRPQSSPVLIIQGTADAVVPPDQSQRLADALHSQGVKADLVFYTGGHGWEGIQGAEIYALQQRAVNWLAVQLHP